MTYFFRTLRNYRLLTAFLFDVLVAATSFFMALAIRYDTFNFSQIAIKNLEIYFVIYTLVCISCFLFSGLYQGLWRFSSVLDLIKVIKSSFIAVISALVIFFYTYRLGDIPRSLFPIQFLLLVFGLGGGRFIYRFWKDYYQAQDEGMQNTMAAEVKKIIILGAGEAGARICREIQHNKKLNLKVVGILDDNVTKKNSQVYNVKIFGPISEIAHWVQKTEASKIIMAIPSASGKNIKRITDLCAECPEVELKILPKMDHLLDSRSEMALLRNVRIEDLLGRESVVLDTGIVREMITSKTILVTGAGGSIGSELCMQISKFKPAKIIFLDSSEFNLYELEEKFKAIYSTVDYQLVLCDVKDSQKAELVFKFFLPEIVFHAAAYKHVPMMELNPNCAIETNIVGTRNMALLAQKHNVQKFVLISTDKAVNPTNIMGASKRVAEMICSFIAEEEINQTQFISVRFGNVLGSSGSVIPLFKKQIDSREDLTVTHPEVVRYFMSIPEASQLVLQAASLGLGNEVFVLNMGNPIKIVDLAREMIRLAGLEFGKDINIKFTGLRPGEKLFEELFSDKENYENTVHEKVRKAKNRAIPQDFIKIIDELIYHSKISVSGNNLEKIVKLLKEIVPEFEHYTLNEKDQINVRPSDGLISNLNYQ